MSCSQLRTFSSSRKTLLHHPWRRNHRSWHSIHYSAEGPSFQRFTFFLCASIHTEYLLFSTFSSLLQLRLLVELWLLTLRRWPTLHDLRFLPLGWRLILIVVYPQLYQTFSAIRRFRLLCFRLRITISLIHRCAHPSKDRPNLSHYLLP